MTWTAIDLGSFAQCAAAEDGYEACGLPRDHKGGHVYSGDRVTGLSIRLSTASARALRRFMLRAKLPPADVWSFYARKCGCTRFAS